MKKIFLVGAVALLSPVWMAAQDECTPHLQISNEIEDGLLIGATSMQRVANDFQIPINTALFSTSQITANLLSQGGIASADILFHEDDNGTPGAIITEYTFLDLVPTSQEVIGEGFGHDLQEVIFDFPFQLEFPGTEVGPGSATYWIQIIATPVTPGTNVAWETTTEGTIGNFLYFDNDLTTSWTESNIDGVFTISGECTPLDGCFFPENITATHIADSSFDIMWTGDATEWSVEYGLMGYDPGSGTSTIISGLPGLTISDFISGYEYDIYIKSHCSDTESEYTGPVRVFFDYYCSVEVLNHEPITHVEVAGISNTSDINSKKGHEYFLDMTATLTVGGTFPIAIQGYTAGNWTNTFVVFIDWNQDYEFNNADERFEIGLLTNSTGTDEIQATGEIIVPQDALLGNTRMRIVKMWDANDLYAPDACEEVIFGQVEDYTVNVDIESSVNFTDYDFKMGPNPTSDVIQITSTENIQSIKVHNILGQQVLNSQTNVQSPQIDMTSLQNGVYLMEITIKDTREVFKIVKH